MDKQIATLEKLMAEWLADAANLRRAGVNAPWFDQGQASSLERCADNLRAAIALMRGQSWQPIETAPKDGSYILASDGEQDGCAVVHWDCDGWVYAWHQYDGPMQMYSATHWQPLPTPPKDTADEQ